MFIVVIHLIPDVKFTPKPSRLIRHLLQIATDKDSLILDSFAGSGTTGHAVLAQNAADGGTRRFILVEMDENICRNITAQRLSRVISGYNGVAALGGGFRFCELGEPLIDERGDIRATAPFADLARHVYFSETGEPWSGVPWENGLPARRGQDVRTPRKRMSALPLRRTRAPGKKETTI